MQVVSLSWAEMIAAHTASLLAALRCDPSVTETEEPPRECASCKGRGVGECERCDGYGEVDCECSECSHEHTRFCKACGGTGETDSCAKCKGSGKAPPDGPLLIPHPADEWTVPSLLALSINGSFT